METGRTRGLNLYSSVVISSTWFTEFAWRSYGAGVLFFFFLFVVVVWTIFGSKSADEGTEKTTVKS